MHDVGRVAALVGAWACGAALVAGCAGVVSPSPSGTLSPSGTASPSGIEAGTGPTTAPPGGTTAPPNPQDTVAAFAATTSDISPELAERMAASWRPGCPVPLSDLRYLTLTYRGFDGAAHLGELVVHADAVEAVTGAFRTLFEEGYPIRSLRLIDDFGADDDASMAADNTSAFNCRAVGGTSTWSQHAYGRAVDVNPIENPYISAAGIEPAEGAQYASRADAPGVLQAGDPAVAAFAAAGWRWGGTWPGAKDYQHFSAAGT